MGQPSRFAFPLGYINRPVLTWRTSKTLRVVPASPGIWKLPMNDTPELLTVADFCARYSCGKTSFYREAAAGRLKLRKFGTATRIARSDAEAWAASLPSRTGAAA